MSSVSPTNQDLSYDTTFSQIKSRVPVPLRSIYIFMEKTEFENIMLQSLLLPIWKYSKRLNFPLGRNWGKCVVNDVNFKCNLLTGPLTNLIFKDRWTILKGTGTRDLIWLKVVSLDRSWLVGLTDDI